MFDEDSYEDFHEDNVNMCSNISNNDIYEYNKAYYALITIKELCSNLDDNKYGRCLEIILRSIREAERWLYIRKPKAKIIDEMQKICKYYDRNRYFFEAS